MITNWKTQDEFPGSISLPFGIKTSHTWHEIGQLLRIVNDLDIQSFVEIGCHVGGLASMMTCVSTYRPFKYIGIEINPNLVDDRLKSVIYSMDVLAEEATLFIRSEIKGRAFYYCDGGNKANEMMFYKNYLYPNDVIACHDYYDGQDVVELLGFGKDGGACGCVPEVSKWDLREFEQLVPLQNYLLRGTRIMGFINERL